MEEQYTAINVIPNTPPEQSQGLPPQYDFSEQGYSQSWSTSSIDDNYVKDNLSLTIPQSYPNHQIQASYLNSPLSPASSTHSLSPGGLASALSDFSIGEQWPEDSLSWTGEQDVLADSPAIAFRDRGLGSGLHLNIASLDDFPSNSTSATSDEEFNALFYSTINFSDSSNSTGHDASSYPSDFGAYAASDEGSLSFIVPSSLVPRSPIPRVPIMISETLSPPLANETAHQRRHSHSYTGAHRDHIARAAAEPSSSLLSPEGPDSNRNQRRHSHSHSSSCATFSTLPGTCGAPPDSSLLSPDFALDISEGSQLQRRHSHSHGSHGRSHEVPDPSIRRARSTSAARRHSPYPRPREIEGPEDYPTPSSEGQPSPRHDTRTSEDSAPPSPHPQASEDMFKRYDNSSGFGYPILQRETIASDAVLQASARRRKKDATHQCPTCGQMLTSKDNLKNHMDAHENIRRHRCDYCHERFRTRSVLKRHQKSNKCPASHQTDNKK